MSSYSSHSAAPGQGSHQDPVARLLPYFYDLAVDCPYGLPQKAVYRQQQFVSMPDELLGLFLQAGFRRNGNTLYTMVCPGCRKCIPIRLEARRFFPNRNQKRVLRRNQDLTVSLGPLKITEEKLLLCGRFLASRYPRQGSFAGDYYGSFFANAMTNTVELEYRLGERLIGVAIVDLGVSWLNAVYFYFDPAEGGRSPGTFNILQLIDFGLRHEIRHIYLGYLIREVKAMRYKEHFKPHYLLTGGQWVESGR